MAVTVATQLGAAEGNILGPGPALARFDGD
jgi:hypothetical protein